MHAQRQRHPRRQTSSLLAALLAAAFGASGSAQAATFMVDNVGDDGTVPVPDCLTPMSGSCTLRGAITAANASAQDDVVIFAPGLGSLITLDSGALVLNGLSADSVLGPGADLLSIDGDGADSVFVLSPSDPGVTLTLSGLTITGGNAATVINSRMPGQVAAPKFNNTGNGGGVAVLTGGAVILDCHITGNNADNFGGGVFSSDQAKLLVSRSTISSNSAYRGAGLAASAFSQPPMRGLTAGAVVLSNVTLADNNASFEGGAIVSDLPISLVNSTVSGNSAGDGTSGIVIGDPQSPIGVLAYFQNSIVLGNDGALGDEGSAAPGRIESRGNNLIGTNDQVWFPLDPDPLGDPSDQSGVAAPAGLAALADNGGPLPTMAIDASSPAFEAGANGACTAAASTDPPGAGGVDARGIARPQPAAGICDIGAFELQFFSLSVSITGSGAAGGSVGDGAGLDCPGTLCSLAYSSGSAVTLTAGGSGFRAFTCDAGLNPVAGSGTVDISMTQDGNCSAEFIAVALDPPSLPDATVGQTYAEPLVASGGIGAYSYTLDVGLPPVGLSLGTGSGAISGIPTTVGSSAFTARATDSEGFFATREYTLNVVCPIIDLVPSSLPAGVLGQAYAAAVTANGSTGFTYAESGGELPDGLSLDPATGDITGTPIQGGDFSFTVTATDEFGCSGARDYAIAATCPGIAVTPAILPSGQLGSNYSSSFDATGGSAPYAFTLQGGALPNGVGLATSGQLSGTPLAADNYGFNVGTTDALGCFGTVEASLQIDRAASLSSLVLIDPDPSEVGEAVRLQFMVQGDFGVVQKGGLPTPTGDVTIAADSGESCSATVAEGFCLLTFADPGSKSLTVAYQGDTQFLPSQANGVAQVQGGGASGIPQPAIIPASDWRGVLLLLFGVLAVTYWRWPRG